MSITAPLINPNTEKPWALLNVAAAGLDDIESNRIASEARMRSMVEQEMFAQGYDRDEMDKAEYAKKEKELKEFLILTRPEFGMTALMLENLEAAEAAAIKALEISLKQGPFWDWHKEERQKGIGAKQLARLLASTGHPCFKVTTDPGSGEVVAERRSISQLWAYGGYAPKHTGQKRRRKDVEMEFNYNPAVKTRAHQIAVSCMKSTGFYRGIYDDVRARYKDAVHKEPCKNTSRMNPNGCATKDHPEWGEVGSPWRDGHQLANALRLTGKQILKDLWIEGNRQLTT